MPRLSIITALFNKEAYIADTIRSVLQQTIRDWEMIVVDNGSTDRGASIARQFADPRIRVIECLKRGPGAARNVGISAATGDWIQFLDADDLLAKTHLSELLACGEKTRCDLVVGRWRRFIDSPSNLLAEEKPAGEGQNRQDLVDYAIARSEEHTLNSSHITISYAVFCLKKKKKKTNAFRDPTMILYTYQLSLPSNRNVAEAYLLRRF